MKVGVFLCTCGTQVSQKVDPAALGPRLRPLPGVAFVEEVAFACGTDGKAAMHAMLTRERPDAVVVAACSVREHEETFRGVLSGAGLNPWMLQLVNVREHIAWVTPDAAQAVDKAERQVRAAIARVQQQAPLARTTLPVNPGVLVVGGGPAGLAAALKLAEAGRTVTLVETRSILGGAPLTYDEVAPSMECGSCLLEPLLARVFHGELAPRLTVHTLAEVTALKGSFGHFTATVRRRPRFVDTATCLGCMACVEPCPSTLPNAFELGLSTRKAMDFEHFGGLPSVPVLEPAGCLRTLGDECTACRDACPVPGCVDLDARPTELEVPVGAVVVATGAGQPPREALTPFGLGALPVVWTQAELERRLSSSGPTSGRVLMPSGGPPESVVLLHGAGAPDEATLAVTASTLGARAARLQRQLRAQHPSLAVHHVFVHRAASDAATFQLQEQARAEHRGEWRQVPDLARVRVAPAPHGAHVDTGEGRPLDAGLVVLLTPPLAPPSLRSLAQALGLPLDAAGWPRPAHPVLERQRTPVRGLVVAGACAQASSLADAFAAGTAAAGAVLADLVEGRHVVLEPEVAMVDAARCSGCKACFGSCPYHALSQAPRGRVAVVNPSLCVGCGACVATCPSAALTQQHFTDAQVLAELAEAFR